MPVRTGHRRVSRDFQREVGKVTLAWADRHFPRVGLAHPVLAALQSCVLYEQRVIGLVMQLRDYLEGLSGRNDCQRVFQGRRDFGGVGRRSNHGHQMHVESDVDGFLRFLLFRVQGRQHIFPRGAGEIARRQAINRRVKVLECVCKRLTGSGWVRLAFIGGSLYVGCDRNQFSPQPWHLFFLIAQSRRQPRQARVDPVLEILFMTVFVFLRLHYRIHQLVKREPVALGNRNACQPLGLLMAQALHGKPHVGHPQQRVFLPRVQLDGVIG